MIKMAASTANTLNRRQFIGLAGSCALGFLLAPEIRAGDRIVNQQEFVFLEAEHFADLGGWDLDQQSMEQMGSPYLLAHGLGVPVRDAITSITLPSAGKYRVWVRTRDWVAPWQAPGAPGKFPLLVDGWPLPEVFGTKGADWHWHDGGLVTVGTTAIVALHDLTGFEGRCDSILFCKDPDFKPVDDPAALTRFRRSLLGLPEHPDDGGTFDLVVLGGGLAGTCAALSAARQGLRVALVQDRPVLGGNGSSEVRVWPEGHTRVQPYPHVGEIVEEILLPAPKLKGSLNAIGGEYYGDAHKLAVVRAEPRISLQTELRVIKVETDAQRITAVVAQNIRTARQVRLQAKFFADCTGDATVGYLAGADYEISRTDHQGMSNLWNVLDAADSKQVLKCECKDKSALATSCEIGQVEQPFPRCPWAIDLSDKPFPGRKLGGQPSAHPQDLGGWFWESGFKEDPIANIERIRDLNFRAMYGAWDTLKNVDKLYPNYRLGWAAFIAGKRESRRLLGDVVLAPDDLIQGRTFPDGAFPCSWHIDLHAADEKYAQGLAGQEFISKYTHGPQYEYHGPYWAPYRCLYSRNLQNLFMAGRDISVTHDGLGPVRVMRTCGMMGEIVGKAAAICIQQNTTPRGVYESHLVLLQDLVKQPGATRRTA